MTKGDRYLTRDRQRAISMAMDEYKREVNINNSQEFIGDYIKYIKGGNLLKFPPFIWYNNNTNKGQKNEVKLETEKK